MANIISRAGRSQAVLLSAARTATPDTQELEIPGGANYLTLVLDATAATATPSVTVTIAGVDRVSGKTYTILQGAAVTSVSTQVLKVGPGLTASANAVANDMLPPVIRITCTHGDTDSITYTVGAHFS